MICLYAKGTDGKMKPAGFRLVKICGIIGSKDRQTKEPVEVNGGTANTHPAFLYGVGHPIEASATGVINNP